MRTEPGQLLRHPSRRMRVLMMASNSQTEERAVVEEGGAGAFLTGWQARVGYWAPAIGIFLSCYCFIRQLAVTQEFFV